MGEAVRQPGGSGWSAREPAPASYVRLSLAQYAIFQGSGQTGRQSGQTDREAEQTDGQGGRGERARSRGLALAEPQLPGWAGAPRGSGCRSCSPNAPAPGPPSRHVLRIPRERPALAPPGGHGMPPLPAPPWSQAVATTLPRQPLPSLQQPLQKRNRAACQRQRQLPRRPAGPWAGGGALPRDPSPAAACVSSRVESPAPAVRGLLAFFLQKRLKMPASRPSATGPTWRAPSS